ncbi:50S ribosomal protein L11 methyltransferase [Parapedobacter koreensis]|uniref:Ribosomal protein L11 methyltransferase n=1 Tax=Parapedobacter koreensis TaxID=332977 RepID=A0A1H7I641_9SPHI|nr:50S ribosomal protein L11 methyltransferase [Parapedobacter koreensis]SEK57898.1 ribosomal protein L11 methyltransferase [Parapedobacter koreensis]
MRYSEVIFTCKGGEDWHQDLLIDSLADMGFDTFEPRDNGFAAYIASEQLDMQSLEALLIHQPVGFQVAYEVNEIPSQNWNAVWERNFEPVVVADQCYVRATFHPPQAGYPYEIVIDPKMAFGTGHHQTTSLMMHYMLETAFEGKRILDMGCGTGILAILAAKLGASALLAIDNDPVCIASVEENKALNHEPNIVAKCGSVDLIVDEQFDVILANINRNILLSQLEQYARSLETGGILYMSGFYDGEDLALLKAAGAQHMLFYESHKQLANWVATRFIKKA